MKIRRSCKPGQRPWCSQRIEALAEHETSAGSDQCLQQEDDVRPGHEDREPPTGAPEAADGAAENHLPIEPHRVRHGAPDRRGEVVLDEILEAEEVVVRAGLPVLFVAQRPGLDRPGRDLVIGFAARPADRGGKLVEPAELAQLGAEHAVILRQPPRVVALHVDDMAVRHAHALMKSQSVSMRPRRQDELFHRPTFARTGNETASGPRAPQCAL